MSLWIIAYSPEEARTKKAKFKTKWGLSYDTFCDEMTPPHKEDFCYYLHPELFKRDSEMYRKIEEDVDEVQSVTEIDSFQIGYGHFHCLRKKLAEAVGLTYDDSNIFNSRIYYPAKLDNTPLIRFFLHSDCDDEFSSTDVYKSYKQFVNLYDKKKILCKDNEELEKEVQAFLKFWKESTDQKLQWKFV